MKKILVLALLTGCSGGIHPDLGALDASDSADAYVTPDGGERVTAPDLGTDAPLEPVDGGELVDAWTPPPPVDAGPPTCRGTMGTIFVAFCTASDPNEQCCDRPCSSDGTCPMFHGFSERDCNCEYAACPTSTSACVWFGHICDSTNDPLGC